MSTGPKIEHVVHQMNAAPMVRALRAIADHLEAGGFKHLAGGMSLNSHGQVLEIGADLKLLYVTPIKD